VEDLSTVETDEGIARLVEMHARILPRLLPVYGFATLLTLASVPYYGWWIIVLVILNSVKSGVLLELGPRRFGHELTHMADQYSSIAVGAGTLLVSGGFASPFLPLIASYAAVGPMIFNRRHGRISFLFLTLMVTIGGFGPPKDIEYESLFRFGSILILMLTLRVLTSELMGSDLRYRAASRIDELTGLANRRAFDLELSEVPRKLECRPRSAALIIADIDHFKRINDEHGHATGDLVLQDVAREFEDSFRADDAGYRIGGEEFAFVLLGIDERVALGMANSLRDRVSVAYPADLSISMSLGVAMYVEGEDPGEWFRRADNALYAAKDAGRNRVEVASEAL